MLASITWQICIIAGNRIQVRQLVSALCLQHGKACACMYVDQYVLFIYEKVGLAI